MMRNKLIFGAALIAFLPTLALAQAQISGPAGAALDATIQALNNALGPTANGATGSAVPANAAYQGVSVGGTQTGQTGHTNGSNTGGDVTPDAVFDGVRSTATLSAVGDILTFADTTGYGSIVFGFPTAGSAYTEEVDPAPDGSTYESPTIQGRLDSVTQIRATSFSVAATTTYCAPVTAKTMRLHLTGGTGSITAYAILKRAVCPDNDVHQVTEIGSNTTGGGLTIVSGAGVSTLQAKGSAGNRYSASLTNTDTVAHWLWIINTTTTPTNTTYTSGTANGNVQECVEVAAGTTLVAGPTSVPEPYANGVYLANSTTGCGTASPTLTLSTVGFLHAAVK